MVFWALGPNWGAPSLALAEATVQTAASRIGGAGQGPRPAQVETVSAAEAGAMALVDGLGRVAETFYPTWLKAMAPSRRGPLPGRGPRGLGREGCSVTFMAVGDILIHDTMRNYSLQKDGSYDFRPNFRYVSPLFAKADLVIGNLENPLAGADKRLSGYPNFNAPQELAGNLKEVGFTTVLISNNHSMDRGWPGLETTIETVRRAGLDYAGAYRDTGDKKRRLISVYNGIKIALLAYTYGLNGYPGPKEGEEWRLGLIDRGLIWSDLKSVQDEGVDFIILSLHFGSEYQRKPNAEQLRLVGELLAGDPEKGISGPDLILGHHPHVAQPFVQIEGGQKGQAVMYSLGNFMTSQPYPYTNIGLILEGRLALDAGGRKRLGPFTLIPTLCHKGLRDGKKSYAVLPLARAVADPESYGLTKAAGQGLAKSLDEINAHLVSMEPDSSKWPALE